MRAEYCLSGCEPMASCLFASPTSRLSSAQRGAECRLPVFHTEIQRNYQGNSLGVTLQRRFHYVHRLSRRRCVGFICSPGHKLLGIPRFAAFLQRVVHRTYTGKDCNPQPANCLKNQYVLRHCCVDDLSGKMGHSVKFLVLTRFDTETVTLFHC